MELNRNLASTDKRGVHGAGVPVSGRLGMALLSLKEDLRWGEGVTGESNAVGVRIWSLALFFFFFGPQENMMIDQKFRVYGGFFSYSHA
jgi:hypothetical protein